MSERTEEGVSQGVEAAELSDHGDDPLIASDRTATRSYPPVLPAPVPRPASGAGTQLDPFQCCCS